MYHGYTRITILFEPPFWVGIYERRHEEKYEAAKVTFGAEPKDYEVYDFFLCNWKNLKFYATEDMKYGKPRKINPKRLHREIEKQYLSGGVGTKAQQTLKLQQEQRKITKVTFNKQQKIEKESAKFIMRQEKLKEKRKGH